MKAPARKQVHVINPSRGVQRREQPAQPLCLIRSDTPGPPRFEELPQTFVTEALDRHSLYVACSVTDYKPTISEQPASLSSPRAWRPSDLAPTSAFARSGRGRLAVSSRLAWSATDFSSFDGREVPAGSGYRKA